jgi:hypothetical protein
MKYNIKNNSGSPIEFENEVHSLCRFAQKRFGFKKPPILVFDQDDVNASKILAKTGYYHPSTMEIHVFITDRHPKDILRSIAHELVHHMQHDKGELEQEGYSGAGYAQKNPHLRQMEKQAYEVGNLCFRDWEDGLKQEQPTIYNERRNSNMSLKEWKNKELGQNLTEKWGFKMDLSKLNEAAKPDFLDIDGDGDKEEPMKDAAEDAKEDEGSVLDGCVKRAVKKGMNESEAKSKCQDAIKDFKEREGREPKSMTLGSTPGENPEFSNMLDETSMMSGGAVQGHAGSKERK